MTAVPFQSVGDRSSFCWGSRAALIVLFWNWSKPQTSVSCGNCVLFVKKLGGEGGGC